MSFQGDSIFWVELEKVVANPYQPRREFDEHKLQELAESVRMYGILQPLTVTKKEIQTDDGAFYSQYELIAGERRLRAAKLAGLQQVPVIIRSGEDTEQEKLELAIIENLQREDLNAVDRALAFKQLADTFDLSHGQVAKKVGRSREYVSNTIRLLLLPEYMLSSLKQGDISEGHARSLLMLKDKPEEQDVVYREILLKKLSVREVERITRKIAADKVRKKNWVGTDPELIAIEREFTDTLGTRVQISKTDFGGKLTIDYFSDDDLQKLLVLMKSQGRMSAFTNENNVGEEIAQEQETVMQNAASSIMAKIAQSTPLEEPTAQSEPESSQQETAPDEQTPSGDQSQQQTPQPIQQPTDVSPVSEQNSVTQVPSMQQQVDSEPARTDMAIERTSIPNTHPKSESEQDHVPQQSAEAIQSDETPQEPAEQSHTQPSGQNETDKLTSTPHQSTPTVLPKTDDSTEINTEEPITKTPEASTDSVSEKKDDDDDLYLIRNFTL